MALDTNVDILPYEAPEKPELTINTTSQSEEESLAEIVAYLENNGYLSA